MKNVVFQKYDNVMLIFSSNYNLCVDRVMTKAFWKSNIMNLAIILIMSREQIKEGGEWSLVLSTMQV